jgi:hypothetical protein
MYTPPGINRIDLGEKSQEKVESANCGKNEFSSKLARK